MNKPRIILLVTAILVVALGCNYLSSEPDMPAPGCKHSLVGGGCNGKTAIIDLKVEPAVDCLRVEVNNCNGGMLEVRNLCEETLVVGNVKIAPSDYFGLDIVEDENGDYSVVEIDSNFSDFIPESDRNVVLPAMLGNQKIEISFVKTAQLCE